MIRPTVGRMIHFFPKVEDHLVGRLIGNDPLAAVVAGIVSDACVNLAVFDVDGSGPHARKDVYLAQPGQPQPENVSYAAWMDYQVGQAAKADAVLGKLEEALKHPAPAEQQSAQQAQIEQGQQQADT